MFSSRKTQSGFSLVELMVVVAIIGVLATLAIPSVSKYIAKARQSEAKTALSSIYTAEKAFYAEYNAYHSMFGAVGYSPEGKMRYNVGFSASTANEATSANGYMATPTGAGTSITTLAYCGTAVAMPNGCMILNGANNAAPAALTGTYTISSGTTFTVGAEGVIYRSLLDGWTIDQNKSLVNSAVGIE